MSHVKQILFLIAVVSVIMLRWAEAAIPNPRYGPVYYQIGRSYEDKNHLQSALNYYRKAVRVNPWLAEAYRQMGIIYAKQERREESLTAFWKAVYLKPDYHEAYADLGWFYRSQGDHQREFAAFMKAQELYRHYPFAPTYTFNLGIGYWDIGQPERAWDSVRDLRRMGEDQLAERLEALIEGQEAAPLP